MTGNSMSSNFLIQQQAAQEKMDENLQKTREYLKEKGVAYTESTGGFTVTCSREQSLAFSAFMASLYA